MNNLVKIKLKDKSNKEIHNHCIKEAINLQNCGYQIMNPKECFSTCFKKD